MTEARQQDIETFINSLPDPPGARTFLERLESSKPDYLSRMPMLIVSRLLTLASYSPFLGETLLLSPEHIEWLKRETERDPGTVKSAEQLSEELGRFSARVSAEDEPSRLARFKRRELLRIYLRDCLSLAALSELTEELSNLADVILTDALGAAHQEMVNRYGSPSARDERGRLAPSEIAIVSLGKLGCRELNYASDIDLFFIYSGEGQTAGDGSRTDSVIGNREFFRNVASRVVRMIGTASGEAPVYRVDLRLRPYGREGDIVWAVETAADYYRHRAQNWERQALIRARGSAGSSAVVAAFFDRVRDVVFRPEPLPEALADVHRLKEKIDRQESEKGGGFNVKLGRGGIREIEFIAQALQLAHGGREPWVRSAQTLIVLARLAEKGYLSEPERSRLSAAYTFLRTVEHRLQMEHGVHTHTLPIGGERMELVARRCGYIGRPDPAAAFEIDLQVHTSAVRAIYNRVFHQSLPTPAAGASVEVKDADQYPDDETERLAKQAASAASLLVAESTAAIEHAIAEALPRCINRVRSLRNFTRWAESLATYARDETGAIRDILAAQMPGLVERLLVAFSSPYLAQMVVSRPALAVAVANPQPARSKEDFLRVMRVAVDPVSEPAARSDALRRVWYEQIVEIGYRDLEMVVGRGAASSRRSDSARGAMDGPTFHAALRENNLEQTALAESSLKVATEIALESLGVKAAYGLRYAVLGLGRLGHSGMDYGSDLDLLVVFDDQAESHPSEFGVESFSPQEFFGKLTAQLVTTLSSVTREGFLYRIDLRLRPDGKIGPLAHGAGSLLAYLGTRASAWEHSAYLKGREVAGDLVFGSLVRDAICNGSIEAAARNPSLSKDLAYVRARLEREKARGSGRDIKWGPGGMTDVYFITRYLQLRERVRFPTELGTGALITHLGESGHLDAESTHVLFDGYGFLRRLDHWMRLLLERPSSVMPSSQTALGDLACALGLDSGEEMERQFAQHISLIRSVYNRILTNGP